MKKVIMYEHIYSELLEDIKQKKYQARDRLPSEKELAEKYKVSRITAKKAMEMLAEKKYIIRNPGRGSFVSDMIDELLDSNHSLEVEETKGKCLNKIISVIFDTFGSDFGSELLKSIEQECRRQKYDMLFCCTYGSIDVENEAIHRALQLGASGMILMCAQGEIYNSTILRLALNEFPLVLVDRQMKGIQIPCIKTDNYSATKELTDMLIKKGHKRLCFVSHASMNTSTINERYSGFVDCILKYDDVSGIFAKINTYNPAPENIGKEYKEFDFREIKTILETNDECTAFLAAEHKIGVLLGRVMKELSIAKEIVSFDGLEFIYDKENPMTHIKQDESKIGKTAVEVLNDIIQGEKREGNINIPYEIIKVD